MANLIEKAQVQLKEKILSALGSAIANEELPNTAIPSFTIETPGDNSHGDLATNVAMVSAKVFKSNPRKIAEIICKHIVLGGTYFSKVEIAGPGFINFTYEDRWAAHVLQAVLSESKDYGKSNYGLNKKVMVEFVSANPTGPMHIGNARGGALGDCLASVLQWCGYAVTREFYVNDAGNQIEKFGLSLATRYLQIYKGETEIPFPEDAYHGEDIKVHAQNFANLHGDSYVHSSKDERTQALVNYALPLNIEKLKTDLESYRIHYDVWFRESSLYQDGSIENILQILKENGSTYEKEGAIWYAATKFGAEKDEVLVRENGNPTYFCADIAYHYNKLVTRGFDKVIDVWGADHHGHVARLKGALSALGIDSNRLDIVLMQMVRLVKGGETVKVSKRTGKSITLTDLLEEIPIDAARFFFNLREANSHFDFDMDLSIEQSSKNPVYYVQYAHARICSILSNLEKEGILPALPDEKDYVLLQKAEEKALIRYIASFPSTIQEAAKTYDPSRITRYSLELAALFHKFYNACKVKGENVSLMQARLHLCIATKNVIKNALTILNIDAPESM